jgi:hypothetical protein
LNAAVAAERLSNQHITTAGPLDPADLVAWFGAVQAQEYQAAKWGLGLRIPGAVDQDVERACDEGRILRTHVMRPTWHFVARRDIRWMLALTAPRVQRSTASYHRHIGLEPRLCVRAAGVFERALRDGRSLTRRELGSALGRVRLNATGIRLALLTIYAELEGVICSGPRRGKDQTYMSLAHRAPAGDLSRDEALAELTRRYFQSHGPATVRDFVWWSGLTTADAKRGLEMNRAAKASIGALDYWTLGPLRERTKNRHLALLPIYDEYLVAYRDREAVPHAYTVVSSPSGRTARFQHALVVNGQVAGTWRLARGARATVLEVTASRKLTRSEQNALAEVVEQYRRFGGEPVSLSL